MPQKAENPVASSMPQKAEDQEGASPRRAPTAEGGNPKANDAEASVGASPRREEDPRQRGETPKPMTPKCRWEPRPGGKRTHSGQLDTSEGRGPGRLDASEGRGPSGSLASEGRGPTAEGGNPKANDAEASDREPYGMDKPGGAGSTGFKESDAEDG